MIAWLALLACGDLKHQETWELIGVDGDLSVIDLRISRSDTGWLRHQGQTRLHWLVRDQTPVLFARDALPEEVETLPQGLAVGPDAVERADDGSWALRVRDEHAQARLTLQPRLGGPSPVRLGEDPGAWTIAAPVVLGELQGVVSAGSRSAVVDGRAVLTHRAGSPAPATTGTERLAVYVLGDSVAVGLDRTGTEQLSWAVVGDLALDARDARLTRGKKGRLVIDLRPTADLVAHVLPRKPRLVRDPWEALHPVERFFARLWLGEPSRRTQGARAQLLVGGERLEARAVIVEERFD